MIFYQYILPLTYNKYIFPALLTGSLLYACVKDNKKCNECNNYNNCSTLNDLRPTNGKCAKELYEFGMCLERNNDNASYCQTYLNAYKKCLQNS